MSGIVLALTLLVTSCRQRRGQARDKMTCQIARQADEHHTTLRLIGSLHAAHLEALQAHMKSHGPEMVLDLDKVTLAEVEVVRFLGTCEQEGTALLHGPPSIREWLSREQRQERTNRIKESQHACTSRPRVTSARRSQTLASSPRPRRARLPDGRSVSAEGLSGRGAQRQHADRRPPTGRHHHAVRAP